MEAKEKYLLFRTLLKHNMDAMNALSGIREAVYSADSSEKGRQLDRMYSSLVSSIEYMAAAYCKMREENSDPVMKNIFNVDGSAMKAITNLEMLLDFAYEDSSLIETAMKGLAKKVENLSKELNNPSNPEFSLSSAKTLHDLIRYFHQRAIEEIFNLQKEDQSGIRVKYPFFNGRSTFTIKLVDFGGGVNGKEEPNATDIMCRPLIELLKGVPQVLDYEIRNIDSKRAFAFVAEDYLDLNIKMGTHIANLCVLFDGNSSYVKFVFKEWCSDGRKKARMKYIGKILQSIGFNTNLEPSSVEAVMEGVGEAKAKEALAQIGRLFVTADNLDWALVNPKQEENSQVLEKCIQRFSEGRYDIVDYAMSINEHPYRKN